MFLTVIAADVLYRKFGGALRYKRQAINAGNQIQQRLQISLYKVRFEVYHCTKEYPYPAKENPLRFRVLYFEKTEPMKKILTDIKQTFKQYGVSSRCWLRENRERDSESLREDCVDHTSPSSSPSNSDTASKRPRIGRLLTTDITDWENNWRFLRKFPDEMTAFDILEDKECVELIVEMSPTPVMGNPVKETDWPRGHLTEKWKNDLRTDDVVDAQDKTKTWYEGLVKQVKCFQFS